MLLEFDHVEFLRFSFIFQARLKYLGAYKSWFGWLEDISVTFEESDNVKLLRVLVLATVAMGQQIGGKVPIEPAELVETREQEIKWNVIVDVPKDTYKADRTVRS